MVQSGQEHYKGLGDIGFKSELALNIFDSLSVGALLIDRNQGVILANTKAATYLNTDRNRLMEEGLRRDDASSGERYLDKITDNVIRSGHPFSQDDIALRVTDDLVSYFSIKVRPLASSPGLAMVTLEDVSEQIEREKHLGEAQARITEVVKYLPDPIFIIEKDGTFTFFSYRDDHAFGYDLPTFTGEKLTGLFADGMSAGEIFLAELQEKGEIEGYETRILDSDNNTIDVSISALNIADPEIGDDAYIGTIRDITESVIRTDEITALKDFSENILDNIDVGVIVLDNNFNIIRWSHGQEIESGIIEADVLGKNILELLPNLKVEKAGRRTIEECGREVLRTGQPFRVGRFLHKDRYSEYEVLDLRFSPLRDNTGKTIGLVIINENITEKVNLERELEEKTTRLEVERNRLVGLFEFANLLRGTDDISGKIGLIINQMKDLGWGSVYCKFYKNDIAPGSFGSVGLDDTDIEILEDVFDDPEEIEKWKGVAGISGNCYLVPREKPADEGDSNDSGYVRIHKTGFFDRWEQDILFILLKNSKNEVTGIIILGRSSEHREMGRDILNVLDLLATSISLIVEEFQTRILIEKRNRGLRAITRMSRDLNSVLTVEGPFKKVLEELKELIGFDTGVIYFEDRGQYNYVSSEADGNEQNIEFPVDKVATAFGDVIRNKKPVLIPDVSLEPGFSGIAIGSAICVPLVFGGEGLGYIYLNSHDKGFFTKYDIELITLIADHTAVAMQNTRYFEEEKLRVRQLSDIYKTGQLAASILNVDELYESVVATLYSQDRYQYVSISTIDKEKRELQIHTYRGPGDDETKRVLYSQSIETGAVGEAARTGKVVYIKNARADTKYEIASFIPMMYSEIAVPITVEGEVHAVLNVENSERNAFNETDIASLGALSVQITVAIRNATLLAKLQEQSDELIKANEELTRFGELREEFVSMLVHDMRTPLTGIIGSAEILDDFIARDASDQIKQLMAIISNEARRMADLINDIRDFYRLIPGEIGLNLEPASINDVLEEVYKFNQKSFGEGDLKVQVAENPDLPVVICDRSKIVLALSNILKTVITHCDIGSDISIVAVREGEESVLINYNFACNGEQCDDIKRFFDNANDKVPSYINLSKSSVLGLSIAETIISAHGGRWGLKSSEGDGSVIYVKIPLEELKES